MDTQLSRILVLSGELVSDIKGIDKNNIVVLFPRLTQEMTKYGVRRRKHNTIMQLIMAARTHLMDQVATCEQVNRLQVLSSGVVVVPDRQLIYVCDYVQYKSQACPRVQAI